MTDENEPAAPLPADPPDPDPPLPPGVLVRIRLVDDEPVGPAEV